MTGGLFALSSTNLIFFLLCSIICLIKQLGGGVLRKKKIFSTRDKEHICVKTEPQPKKKKKKREKKKKKKEKNNSKQGNPNHQETHNPLFLFPTRSGVKVNPAFLTWFFSQTEPQPKKKKKKNNSKQGNPNHQQPRDTILFFFSPLVLGSKLTPPFHFVQATSQKRKSA